MVQNSKIDSLSNSKAQLIHHRFIFFSVSFLEASTSTSISQGHPGPQIFFSSLTSSKPRSLSRIGKISPSISKVPHSNKHWRRLESNTNHSKRPLRGHLRSFDSTAQNSFDQRPNHPPCHRHAHGSSSIGPQCLLLLRCQRRTTVRRKYGLGRENRQVVKIYSHWIRRYYHPWHDWGLSACMVGAGVLAAGLLSGGGDVLDRAAED